MQTLKQRTRNSNKTKNDYLSAPNDIQNLSDAPKYVKREARRLSSLQGLSGKESNNAIFNITANDSNEINCGTGTCYTSQHSPPNTKETALKSTPDLTHVNDEHDSEKEDEEDEMPPDLTIDHHPHRTCEYTLNYAESDEASTSTGADEDDSKWIISNTCISDLCLNLKSTTLQIVKNAIPALISDIRILVYYIFSSQLIKFNFKQSLFFSFLLYYHQNQHG
ncbi:unnamed protein product [Mucor circinelloides]